MLRNKSNRDLLTLYDSDLILRVRNTRNLENERRFLASFLFLISPVSVSIIVAWSYCLWAVSGTSWSKFTRPSTSNQGRTVDFGQGRGVISAPKRSKNNLTQRKEEGNGW
jgi:hypothetical protein